MILNRIHIARWAKVIAHEDTYLVKVIQDGRMAVLGEMIATVDRALVYGRYTIGAKDLRGGVSKRGVRSPQSILEGCSVMDVTPAEEWGDGYALEKRLNKALEVAKEGGSLEHLNMLHTVSPVKVREGGTDFYPVLKDKDPNQLVCHGMVNASALTRVVADQLVAVIPPSRTAWKWYELSEFDDYMCSSARYPIYAYQYLVAAMGNNHSKECGLV